MMQLEIASAIQPAAHTRIKFGPLHRAVADALCGSPARDRYRVFNGMSTPWGYEAFIIADGERAGQVYVAVSHMRGSETDAYVFATHAEFLAWDHDFRNAVFPGGCPCGAAACRADR